MQFSIKVAKNVEDMSMLIVFLDSLQVACTTLETVYCDLEEDNDTRKELVNAWTVLDGFYEQLYDMMMSPQVEQDDSPVEQDNNGTENDEQDET